MTGPIQTNGASHHRLPMICAFAATLCVGIMAGCQNRSGAANDAFAAGGGTAAARALVGPTWIAEDIGGRGVIDNLQSSLTFDDAGTVSGSGGCNRFGGAVRIEDESIAFGQLATTRMACGPAIDDQERKFFAALEATRRFSIDQRGLLFFHDRAGAPVMRLSRRD